MTLPLQSDLYPLTFRKSGQVTKRMSASFPAEENQRPRKSLQPRILGLGFFQDGDVGVGIFPEREKIFVGGERAHAGGVGLCTLRSFELHGVRTRQSQMCQRSGPAVPDNAVVVDDFLKLSSCSFALPCRQVRPTPHIHGIKAGNIMDELNLPQFEWQSNLQGSNGGGGVFSIQCQLCPRGRQPKRLNLSMQWKAFP